MTSTDLYRDIVDFAHDTPGPVHTAAELGTDAGLLLLVLAALAVWWRARRADARTLALALLVPLATVVAYGCSEFAKGLVDEERPCRAVADAAPPLAACPAPGDWSFPSNHATLAAALAVGIAFALPRTAPFLVPLAALLGFSRIFVGVHYPHDVAAGLLLGAVCAALCARALLRPATALVERRRGTAAGPAGRGRAVTGSRGRAVTGSRGRAVMGGRARAVTGWVLGPGPAAPGPAHGAAARGPAASAPTTPGRPFSRRSSR